VFWLCRMLLGVVQHTQVHGAVGGRSCCRQPWASLLAGLTLGMLLSSGRGNHDMRAQGLAHKAGAVCG
jgi:hypothetical protein